MEGVVAPETPDGEVKLPMYWNLISGDDQRRYTQMRHTLSSSACKHRRNHAREMTQDVVMTIRAFVIQGNDDDWKRALVCGICWLAHGVALNTQQLRLLLSRCKSSVNAMFQSIGFVTGRTTVDHAGALATFFPRTPGTVDILPHLRQWTMRFKERTPDNLEPGGAELPGFL